MQNMLKGLHRSQRPCFFFYVQYAYNCAYVSLGLIHVDDTIVEVNGVSAKGKNPESLIKMLHGYRGALTFKLIPGESKRNENGETVSTYQPG